MPTLDRLSKRRAPAFLRALLVLALPFVLVGVPASVLADALVNVEVRSEAGQPVDGVVVLQARAGGQVFQCTTAGGSCRIDNVPGGQYTATFTPAGGSAQAPRTVMIPPAGTVSLRVAAR
ncbi:MAG: carboxypeptidase regulatory-like domain-containing protein [Sandaracinaceae bacterium]|nr:carboxypeptidase regulatory-like domain-containing protein [Sandaracinaceae bacterium]